MSVVRAMIVVGALLMSVACSSSGARPSTGDTRPAVPTTAVGSAAAVGASDAVPSTPTPWWSSSCAWWRTSNDRPEYRELSVAEADRQAIARGLRTRLFAVDGIPRGVTEDYNEQRVNLVVEAGFVVCAGIA